MDKNHDYLDHTVHYERSAVANQKVIMGTRTEIKRDYFMKQNEENEVIQETSVRVIMKSEEGTRFSDNRFKKLT